MKKLVALVILMATGTAFAQDSNTTAEKSTLTLETNQSGAQKKDIDEEITNAKLRAATGSKKTISMASSFNYYGGALTSPMSTERPQLNDGQASADPAKLSGQIAVKWRATDHDNLSLGFGLDFTPSYVSNRATGEKEPARTNASTPYLSYARVFKAGGLQNVFDATVYKYTAKEDVDGAKLNSEVALSHTMMGSVLTPALELGLASYVAQEIYSESQPKGTLYTVQLAPILEYAFNDTVSFRTVYRALTMTSANSNRDAYRVADTTQSMGVGFAVTRDIYLYPNMQWKWKTISADQTTVGMSANINL